MRVTVTVRPWTQNRATAAVAINKRASLTPYVRASPQTFDLAPGSRTVTTQHAPLDRQRLALRRHPGVRQAEQAEGAQRDHPAVGPRRAPAPEPDEQAAEPRVGTTDVVGRGNGRSLILAVRNTGNTLDPVGGTVTITGPTPRNATIPPVGIVPGQVVYLKGGALSGMKAGNYTATWSITQGSKRYTASGARSRYR